MAYNTYELLELAQRLCISNQTEATYRTVISRSYYASHLPIRKALQVYDSRGGIHVNTVRELRKQSHRDSWALADILDRARKERGNADYDLDRTYDLAKAQKHLKAVGALLKRCQEAGIIPNPPTGGT
jgi:hypothetical protein